MKIFAVIVILLFLGKVGYDVWNSYSPKKYKDGLEKELATVESMKTWEYYLCKGAFWTIDLLAIIVLIYGAAVA